MVLDSCVQPEVSFALQLVICEYSTSLWLSYYCNTAASGSLLHGILMHCRQAPAINIKGMHLLSIVCLQPLQAWRHVEIRCSCHLHVHSAA